MPRPALLALTALLAACTAGAGGRPAPDAGAAAGLRPQSSGSTALLIGVSPVDERVVWVSGSRGTWLRTLDGGTTWRGGRVPGADTLQFRDVHAVDARTAYLLSIGPGEQSRIYKTTVAGERWTLQFTNPDPEGFYDCMDFWDPERGLVIGDAIRGEIAILSTMDGGRTWRRLPPGSLPAAAPGEGSFAASGTCLTVGAGGRAWVVMSTPERARVLFTTDFGATWQAASLPLTTRAGVGPQSIAFRDALNGIVLGGGYASRPGDVLAAVTRDGGRTWSPVARPPLPSGVWGGAYVQGARRPTVVAVGPAGAVRSDDEGRTWASLDTANYWSVAFASPRAGWAVGASGRITRLGRF